MQELLYLPIMLILMFVWPTSDARTFTEQIGYSVMPDEPNIGKRMIEVFVVAISYVVMYFFLATLFEYANPHRGW